MELPFDAMPLISTILSFFYFLVEMTLNRI